MSMRRVLVLVVAAVALALGVAAGVAVTAGPALANEVSTNGA